MTLATHMVTGAAAARIFSTHPAQAFFIGWLSHYVFDSIVHWDYPLQAYLQDELKPLDANVSINKFLLLDIAKVLVDAGVGFALVFIFSRHINVHTVSFLILGALGGAFPDFIQFLYSFIKLPPLQLLQRFHHFMHNEKKLDNRPVLGLVSQVCVVLVAGVILYSSF